MPERSRQVGQSRPSGTSAASILNDARPWEVTFIVVSNTGSTTAKYSVYHDENGTTYSTATALFYEISLPTGTTHTIELPIRNDDRLGHLAVQTDTADTVTFTVYGSIEGERR
jgi:hypothetical protein